LYIIPPDCTPLKRPGIRSGFPSDPIILFPSLSFFNTPLVLIFPAILLAIFLSFVFRLILYAINISLAPVAVEPLFGTKIGLP